MAILKSTVVNGDLTVTGSLNVQGDLTYVGVENLRVKDHQIELNANDKGSASLAGADQAGIVIRGARTTENVKDDASILYNHADDSLVINKTIKGTVSNATTATSADKVANKLTVTVTNESGSVNTVEFDGSAEKTIGVDLSGLQNQINSLTGGAGSIATQISNAIKELDVTDAAVAGQYVSSVSEADGKISVTRAALPDYTEVYDKKGAAAAVKTELIGKDNDTETSDTIKGAKKYADSLAGNYDAAGTAAGLNAAMDKRVQALEGDRHTHANQAELDKIVEGDVAKWNGKQNALTETQLAAVNSGITATKVTGYDNHVANKNIHVTADDKKKWNAAETNAIKHADELNTAMDGRVKVLEAIDHNALAASASAAAVAQVVADAPADFDTLKEVADWIQNDTTGAAALQTDVAGLKTKVSTLESASHTHANKAELDKIVDGDKAKWDGHVNNADIHVTAQQKADWDAKQDALTNANVLKDITSTHVSNWNDAFAKAHEHTNKTVLDGITADKVAAWDGAVSAAGVSSVGGKAGALTLKGGSATLGDVNLSISDTGEISAAIVPDSFDAKGDAAKALADAKTYVDGKVDGKFDAAGAAATVKSEVIGVDGDAANKDTIYGAKKYADTAVKTLSDSVAAKDAAQDAEITNIQNDIANIKNGTALDDKYVNASGDTMTGNLTMPSNGTNGIVFGNMKIVWNSANGGAIEFVPVA